MKLLKYISIVTFQICIVVAIVLLFVGHFSLQSKFDQHWHYSPKSIIVAIDEPHIGQDVPYHLTKPKPKREDTFCSYWVYSYCGR